jgi:trk system potassium uptake protein TrkH
MDVKKLDQKRGFHFTGHFHPSQLLVISFLTMIVLGAGLLTLPCCHTEDLTFLDALFTTTSATCVTGLIVVDTDHAFTIWGQLIILVLIQMGGLGIMTFSAFFAYLFGGRISIRNRDLMEKTVSGMPEPNLGKLLWSVFMGTLVIETLGAIVLTMQFLEDFAVTRAIYLGIFHSVSAFCNAGFALFSNSFMGYKHNLVINLTLMILITLGGLGFSVIYDLMRKGKHPFKTSLLLHSKIVLAVSSCLTGIGFLLFLLFEWQNTLQSFTTSEKFLSAIFQVVTTRTAGFNTLDTGSLTNSSLLLMIIFMMIGASPGSCGGGIKTTTFGVLIGLMISRVKNRHQVQLFKRGISESTISRVISVTFFWLIFVVFAGMILLVTEHPGGAHETGRTLFIEVFFEIFSAMGTVGLSMGLTQVLTAIGKILLILIMFIGRLGPLTLAVAIATKYPVKIKLAEEELFVG